MINVAMEKVSKMKKIIGGVKEYYDYVMIDVPPSPGWHRGLALSCCDYAGVIVTPSASSVTAAKAMAETLEEAQDSNPSIKMLGLLYNRMVSPSKETKKVKNQRERMIAFAKELGWDIFENPIKETAVLIDQDETHLGITEMQNARYAAENIRALTDEFIRKTTN